MCLPVCLLICLYVRIFFIHSFFSFSSSLEQDVMCGYRLYFTNATWYTAFKICEEEKKMLILPDSDSNTFEAIFSHLIKKPLEATSFINRYVLLKGHLNHLGDLLRSFFVCSRALTFELSEQRSLRLGCRLQNEAKNANMKFPDWSIFGLCTRVTVKVCGPIA